MDDPSTPSRTDPIGGDDVVGDAGLDDPSDTEDALEALDDEDELSELEPVEDSFGEGPE
ncbi:hypothetical protein KXS11_16330 [Plantibacter flavus]|uniref:hypothetical protein n=1 Tax=Plantibacter flavus TaxID=150123 RepID=UPI003F18C38E